MVHSIPDDDCLCGRIIHSPTIFASRLFHFQYSTAKVLGPCCDKVYKGRAPRMSVAPKEARLLAEAGLLRPEILGSSIGRPKISVARVLDLFYNAMCITDNLIQIVLRQSRPLLCADRLSVASTFMYAPPT